MAVSLNPNGLTLGNETKGDWADVGGGTVSKVFTSSGNVTKGSAGDIHIMAAGGGSGGVRQGGSNPDGANGASSFGRFTIKNVPAGSTVAVNVGSGGAGKLTNNAQNPGNPGAGNASQVSISGHATVRINGAGISTNWNQYNDNKNAASGGNVSVNSGSSNVVVYGNQGGNGAFYGNYGSANGVPNEDLTPYGDGGKANGSNAAENNGGNGIVIIYGI